MIYGNTSALLSVIMVVVSGILFIIADARGRTGNTDPDYRAQTDRIQRNGCAFALVALVFFLGIFSHPK
jgi:hypothetical protein